MYISTREMIISIICNACGVIGLILWAIGVHTWVTNDKLRKTEPMKTTDYCDICKQDGCQDCIADATNPYCVPSHYEINYEPNDEPQTERSEP